VFLGPDLPSAPGDAFTQRLEPDEIARLMRKAEFAERDDAPSAGAGEPLSPNRLPDVYPENESDRPGKSED
jgi:hypothetical protein